MLDQLQASDFEPFLNQTMNMRFSPEVILPAEMVEVRQVRGESPLARKPFTVVMRTNQTTHYYQQTICTLEHPEKGDLDLFFVPVGFDGKGVLYEAAFS